MHGPEKYKLHHKKDPITIAWVHFIKYIAFSSKPFTLFIKKVNGTRTCGSLFESFQRNPLSVIVPLVTSVTIGNK